MKAPKNFQKPKSVEIVGSSDDLLMEILLRVPIKSLLRFKTVSKQWQSLITNPEFCLRRNPNPNPNPVVGLLFPEPDDPILKYVPLFSPNNSNSSITTPVRKLELLTKNLYGVTILQSCNGLLLLCRRFTSTSTKQHHYVYNPTTNQSSNLPAAMKTIQQRASSGEIVGSSDDLLMEILLRLPTKSLLRFKTVSKQWQSLITNPEFCLRRNPNPNPNPAVGLLFPEPDDPILKYVPLFSPNNSNSSITTPVRKLELLTKHLYGVSILHSCNGLLLLCRRFTSKQHYVYNPTTNQSSKLPAILGESSLNIRGLSLAFDPAKSSPHYKVVCVCNDPNLVEVRYQIHIYSSESGAWRISSEPFAANLDFENGVYWNGAVHWISKWFDDSLYFNVNHHVLEKMPSPPLPERRRVKGLYFGESCDHLHYVWTFALRSEFNVYEMKMDYSEWFAKYRVNLSKVARAYPQMVFRYRSDSTEFCFYNFCISTIVRGEEEDGSFLVLQIPGKVIRYNFVSKTFEKLHEIGGMKYFQLQVGFQFIESLCSL